LLKEKDIKIANLEDEQRTLQKENDKAIASIKVAQEKALILQKEKVQNYRKERNQLQERVNKLLVEQKNSKE